MPPVIDPPRKSVRAQRPLARLRPLVDAWQDTVRLPQRRVVTAFALLVAFVALRVARTGTAPTRVVGLALLVALGLGIWLARSRERRVFSDAARTVHRVAGRFDPERAGRALRALSLIDEGGAVRDEGVSPELARLHVERAVGAISVERVTEGAARIARRLGLAAIVLAALSLGVLFVNPWAVVEGADVLLAHGGVAPMSMRWLGDVDVHARPPEYLHQTESRAHAYAEIELPHGTLLTFRGRPLHAGRRLLLTDGVSEVPFVDDGAGSVVARWPLGESVDLRVVSRFGSVRIEEPDATRVVSIPDEAPRVTLEGAPKRIQLAGGDNGADVEVTEIPIRYEATDDHGLREVHLVLQSGAREERRVLARLDGETRVDRGGHVLKVTDPFVRRSHAPIEVRVEAKDNDPITGPKWGASPAITLIPPEVGEPEARRMDALRELRDTLVDSLAWRMAHQPPAVPAGRAAFIAELVRDADHDADVFEATLTSSYAGVRIPSRLQAMLRGQMRKVKTAVDNEVRSPSAFTHGVLVTSTERLVLVVDAMIRGLGLRDSRQVARALADVADDLVMGLTQVQHSEPGPAAAGSEAERGGARTDAAVTVLTGGGRSLGRLGLLGHDIGEIVGADLSRVGRARTGRDLAHAELAARDLAARLHQPDPSFGAQGSSGRAGGESGGGRGTMGDGSDGEQGEAERAFDEAAQDIERLAQDHAGQVGKVEQLLGGAVSQEELKALGEEAKKHAAQVRDATSGLPTVGAGSDSWTSKGAAAHEHAEQMAHALEHGDPADAVQSGRDALQALDEAKRIAARERWSSFATDDHDADRRIDEARRKLEPEVRWSEQKLQELRRRAAERAASELAQGGEEEDKMADRARDIGDKGRDQGTLPAPALDSLSAAEKAAHEAAQALRRGDADRGLDRQREAQRMLEMAREALGEGSGEERGGEGDDGDRSALDHADIPKADAHKGPEEFRRRVIQGLGRPSDGKHRDAIRRYAEGLLR